MGCWPVSSTPREDIPRAAKSLHDFAIEHGWSAQVDIDRDMSGCRRVIVHVGRASPYEVYRAVWRTVDYGMRVHRILRRTEEDGEWRPVYSLGHIKQAIERAGQETGE